MQEQLCCPICQNNVDLDQSKKLSYPNVNLDPQDTEKKIVACTNCEMSFVHPMPTEAETKIIYSSGAFWQNQVPNYHLMHRRFALAYSMTRERWNFIQKNHQLPENFRVLDVGAGFGFFGLIGEELFPSRMQEYVVVEPDLQLQKQLQKFWSHNVKGKELRIYNDLSEIAESFDLVVLSHVLEHVTEPLSFLEQAKTKVKESGCFFVEVPQQDQNYKHNVWGHVLFFNPDTIRYSLNKFFKQVTIISVGNLGKFSPMDKRASFLTKLLEKVVYKLRYFLPYPLLCLYYSMAYGYSQESRKGAWVRALAMNKI